MFKEEPRKVCFTYDLFLNLEGNPPVNHLRCEKLTFNNPTIEFRYKLLMAGGVSVPRAGGPGPRRRTTGSAAPSWLPRGFISAPELGALVWGRLGISQVHPSSVWADPGFPRARLHGQHLAALARSPAPCVCAGKDCRATG